MNAVLRFVSYAREGIARSVAGAADADGVPTAAVATVDVTLRAGGADVARAVAVRGPGAVIGLAPGEVVRCVPADGTTHHEPSSFAAVELRSAALPWMFTPAQPHDGRLMPWLVLVVVEDRPGVTLDQGRVPLPVLTVDEAARELPDLREAWAWAHVEVDGDYDEFGALLEDTPELARARLLCPRLL